MVVAMPSITHIKDILTNRENISSKSIPFFWLKPFTTNLALYLGCELCYLVFTVYTHLFLSAFLPFGKDTNLKVSFSYYDCISSYMASNHSFLCSSDIASS
jgi:hypothetical protein